MTHQKQNPAGPSSPADDAGAGIPSSHTAPASGMTPEDVDQMRRDMERPQVRAKSESHWRVVIDGPSHGWVEVLGPSFTPSAPTTASDLNGEDWIARHADARRIARVPQLEAEVLRLREALEWYANLPDEWTVDTGTGLTCGSLRLLGEKARAALKGTKP